jgi:ATP-dependent DNA helicase DinG
MDQAKLKQTLAGLKLEQRDSQLEMFSACTKAIAHNTLLCVEAPTGIGKTLAYCLAALSSKTKDETVIISTATVALQDQLLHSDVPLLEKILNRKIKAAIAKGRRRYVCHARVFQQNLFQLEENHSDIDDKLQNLLNKNQWAGDRDSLDLSVSPKDWQRFSTDRNGCTGGRCAYFEECAFFKARRAMETAELVITNHNLLLSDLELGGGVLLPETKSSIYILDECHHIPDKATDFFALQAALMRSTDWINTLNRNFLNASPLLKLSVDKTERVQAVTKSLVAHLTQMHRYLSDQPHLFDNNVYHITQVSDAFEALIKPIIHDADQISQQLEQLHQALENAFELCDKNAKEKQDSLSNLIASTEFTLDRAENLALSWQSVLQEKDPEGIPIARWVEKKPFHGDESLEFDFTCHASPINASQKLRDILWKNISHGAILCSATIRSLGSFKHFLRRTGLNKEQRVETLALLSPFDYRASKLVIPFMKHLPTGQSQEKHLNEISDCLPNLLERPNTLGTLVLFTSLKAMNTIYDALPTRLRLQVFMQGEKGKHLLIQKHKRRIDNDKPSILFGLASFAEGLDLPGRYCEHVIIQKIPFVVPSDPIEKTRTLWLEANQLNPFMLSMLPQASTRLTQYVGRLLRRQDDTGQVTILDQRLVSKYYGKQLLDNLPPFDIVIEKA